jgi:hypothetical protein
MSAALTNAAATSRAFEGVKSVCRLKIVAASSPVAMLMETPAPTVALWTTESEPSGASSSEHHEGQVRVSVCVAVLSVENFTSSYPLRGFYPRLLLGSGTAYRSRLLGRFAKWVHSRGICDPYGKNTPV